MLKEFTIGRQKALILLAQSLKVPSRELTLEAIMENVSQEDLRWVTDKVHYFLLKLLEEAEFDPVEETSCISLS